MLHPVIMAGGSGTRFWPMSRHDRPKQLIEIAGKGTMLQQTVERLDAGVEMSALLVLTNVAHAEEVRRQLPRLAAEQILCEPVGRDSAAAIGLAAFALRKRDPDAVMAAFAADQIISPASELTRCMKEAAEIARRERALVTFGIRPTSPSVFFGYIRRGKPVGRAGASPAAYRIAEFREKPTRAQAEEYLKAGEYYWNSGNFVWRVDDIIEAIRRFLPELYAGLERIEPALWTARQEEALAREFPRLPRVSIDYGVMEKASNAVVVEATFEWDDVGSWEAVARHNDADGAGNVAVGTHVGLDTSDCIVVAAPDHIVATIGLKGLVVVHTPDATLVCDRSRVAEVKGLVEALKKNGLSAHI